MSDANKNPFMDMFQSFGEQLKLPGADLEGMMDMHRKNLQALQAVTQIGTSSAQAVMEKQRAQLESALAEIADMVQSASAGGDASQAATAPLDMARKSFDTALKNAGDIGEIIKQGNEDAFNVWKDRVMEAVEEVTGKKMG